MKALRKTFAEERKPDELVFRMATAFTHLRRERIIQTLENTNLDCGQLKTSVAISGDSLRRHLKKLLDRGFVRFQNGKYRRATPKNAFARALSRAVSDREG